MDWGALAMRIARTLVPAHPWSALLALTLVLIAPLPALADVVGHSSLRFGPSKGPYSESYAPESLDVRVSSFERYHLGWRWQADERMRVLVDLSRGGLAIADQDFPDTVHQRTETEGRLGGMLDFDLLGGTLGMGAGYAARVVEVTSSAKAPGSDPAFLFAPWQAFQGMAFLLDYRRPLLGPFGFALDAGTIPYGFAHLGDSRLTLPSFWAVSVHPRLTFWGDRLAIGYRYERTFNPSYGREATALTASFVLSGF